MAATQFDSKEPTPLASGRDEEMEGPHRTVDEKGEKTSPEIEGSTSQPRASSPIAHSELTLTHHRSDAGALEAQEDLRKFNRVHMVRIACQDHL